MKHPIELVAPLGACPEPSVRPTFQWRTLDRTPSTTPTPPPPLTTAGRGIARADFSWRLRVWAMPSGGVAAKIIAQTSPLVDMEIDGRYTSFVLTERIQRLAPGRAYLWQVDAVGKAGQVTSSSAPGIFFANDPNASFPMAQWLCCNDGDSVLDDDFEAWKRAYGTPTFASDSPGGGDSVGVIRLNGDQVTGDCVTQDVKQPITAGEHYVVSFCARSADQDLLTQFRVFAHNGTLPTSGAHPPTSESVLPIGVTGSAEPGEWTWFVFAPWRAPRDFTRVAIAANAVPPLPGITPSNKAVGEISRICIRRVDNCDGFFAGGPELSFGTGIVVDTAQQPYAQAVSSDLGAMVDLFGEQFDANGDSSWYRAGDGCVSIGGWVPDDVEAHTPWADAESQALGIDTINGIIKHIADELLTPELTDRLTPIDLVLDSCADHEAVPNPRETRAGIDELPIPFGGRDIVFVHGVVPNVVMARGIADDQFLRANHDAQAQFVPQVMLNSVGFEWPENPAPYTADLAPDGPTSYFRREGESYWEQHIQKYLLEPGHPNRYLATGFNSSQRLVYGVHAVLSQIARAMTTGEGVRDPHGDQGTGCFGKELVFITHSTGALLVNVALSIAASTGTAPSTTHTRALRDTYGDLSKIAERAKVHIAMHGAIAGSNVAQAVVAGMGLARGGIALTEVTDDVTVFGLRTIVEGLSQPDDIDETRAYFDQVIVNQDTRFAAMASIPAAVRQSVFIDLCPIVAKTIWPQFIGSCPVPTLTIAGGHPTHGGIPALSSAAGHNWPTLITKLLLSGFDDGAVNVQSQAGSNSLAEYDAFVYAQPEARLFDMGLPLNRSAPYHVQQVDGPLAAYGSIPFLGPAGMLQPVLTAPIVPRFPNIYPFIQAPSEHSFAAMPSPVPVGAFRDYERTVQSKNYEECLVLQSRKPFDDGLIDRTIEILVRRHERRLDLTVNLLVPVPRITLVPPSFVITMTPIPQTITVWRRFYDLLSPEGGSSATSVTNVAVAATPNSVTISSSWPIPDRVEAALDGTHRKSEIDYAYQYIVPT